ncbi:MAG: hypothetical protein NTZ67_05470 [Gammaproteobacteria bacterium]|nr:hypothetical protein [Gammaproteobacteria bacterium]
MYLSILFYFLAFIVALCILRLYSSYFISPFIVVFMSMLGHAVGTYFYSTLVSDSKGKYFPYATPVFHGFGTDFSLNIVWVVRHFLTGDSLLSTFYFFSAFAFLGSVLWYLLYLKCVQKLRIQGKALLWPALVLMSWPTALFFTAGIGKDSLSYFFIPLAFLSYLNIATHKNKLWNSCLLFLSLSMVIMIRPYLALIFSLGYFLYLFPGWKKIRWTHILSAILMFIVLSYVAIWVFRTQGKLSVVNIGTVATRAQVNQISQSTGTHFYMPGTNPLIRLLLLPYSFVMNLCFPLFYLARNLAGFLASLENLVLVYILFFTYRRREIVKKLFGQFRQLKLLFCFFLVGMFFLAAINTNLGLSVRERCMYLPCFLVIYCILYAYKKRGQKIIKK